LQGFFCEISHWTGVDTARLEGIREDKITAHLQRTIFATMANSGQIIAYKKSA
jgi:hypothetical protein